MTFLMCARRVEQIKQVPAKLVAEFLYETREDDVWDAGRAPAQPRPGLSKGAVFVLPTHELVNWRS
jgi:hypothetical protein